MYAPGDAGNAEGVVADGADDAGDVGAVAAGEVVFVAAGGGAGDARVDAVDVVDVAVVIVVAAVAGDLAGVAPEVGEEVAVGEAGAGVNDGDDDGRGIGAEVPAGGGIDIGPEDAAKAVVAEVPLAAVDVGRVVGFEGGLPELVEFDELVVAGGGEGGAGGGDRFAGGDGEDAYATDGVEAAGEGKAGGGFGGGEGGVAA